MPRKAAILGGCVRAAHESDSVQVWQFLSGQEERCPARVADVDHRAIQPNDARESASHVDVAGHANWASVGRFSGSRGYWTA